MVWKGYSQSIYHWLISHHHSNAYIFTSYKSSGQGFCIYYWIILNLHWLNIYFHYLSVRIIVLSLKSIMVLVVEIFSFITINPYYFRWSFERFRKLTVSSWVRWVKIHCIQIQSYFYLKWNYWILWQ